MILLIRKRFLVMEALQSNFEMPLMLSYIYMFFSMEFISLDMGI